MTSDLRELADAALDAATLNATSDIHGRCDEVAIPALFAEIDRQAAEREALVEALERISDPVAWFRDHCVPDTHIWDARATIRMYESGRWHEHFAAEALAARITADTEARR